MTQETNRTERVEAFSENVIAGAVYPLCANAAMLVPIAILALGLHRHPLPTSWNNYAAGASAGCAITAGVLFLVASCFDGWGKGRDSSQHPVSSAFGKIAGIALPTVAAVVGALVFNAVDFLREHGTTDQVKNPVPAYAPAATFPSSQP